MILSCSTYAKKDTVQVKYYIKQKGQHGTLSNVVDFVRADGNIISNRLNTEKDPAAGIAELKNINQAKYSLKQNFPNPFNSTIIEYSTPKSNYVSLNAYNILRQDVLTFFTGYQKPGNHTINFNGTNLSGGIYLYRLDAGDVYITKNLFL